MTTELKVKTIVLEPAKVEFNFDELSKVLDKRLEKYEGLEFTEKEAAACKKVITELNKGKKSLSDYRISTKKELTVSITEFEARCKNLSNKFDDVIAPLKEQADEFEENRKDEKRKLVEGIINELLEKEDLNDKFAAELDDVPDSYLTKSKTLKSIKEELTTKADHLGIQQDKLESDIQIIKMTVDMANERHDVNLLEQTYIRLLDYKGIEEIKQVIADDAEQEVKKQDVKPEPVVVPVKKTVPTKKKPAEEFIEKYEITGTDEQLAALEDYMSSHGLSWSVINDD